MDIQGVFPLCIEPETHKSMAFVKGLTANFGMNCRTAKWLTRFEKYGSSWWPIHFSTGRPHRALADGPQAHEVLQLTQQVA